MSITVPVTLPIEVFAALQNTSYDELPNNTKHAIGSAVGQVAQTTPVRVSAPAAQQQVVTPFPRSHVVLAKTGPTFTIHMLLETMHSSTTVVAARSTPVTLLVQLAEEETGLERECHCLLFGAERMRSDQTLGDYDIEEGSVVLVLSWVSHPSEIDYELAFRSHAQTSCNLFEAANRATQDTRRWYVEED